MKKGWIVLGVLVLAVAAVIVGPKVLRPKVAEVEISLPVVEVTTPQTGSIELYRELTGTVEPSDVVYINPKMAGEVTAVHIKVGDMVQAGQILCEIDTKQVDSAKLTLDGAAIALSDARTNLSRMEVLYSAGDISAQAIEQYRTSVKTAQISYDGAKLAYDTQLEYSTITAPISGKVENVNMEVFDTVSQQNQICVISGEGSRVVSFSVPEKIVNKLSANDSIVIEKSGSEYEGMITEVNSMIDAATGLFKIKATVKEGDALATGSIVKLSVISDHAENVMTLPVDTVYYSGGDAFLYVYDNGVVRQVPITVGIFDAETAEILDGVTMADQIITTWSSELFEGSQVELSAKVQ